LARYREAAVKLGAEIDSFFFLDAEDTVRLAHLSSIKGTITMVEALKLCLTEVVEVKLQFFEAII
jgi:hypothetical protein